MQEKSAIMNVGGYLDQFLQHQLLPISKDGQILYKYSETRIMKDRYPGFPPTIQGKVIASNEELEHLAAQC
jgi:hypothetical protein